MADDAARARREYEALACDYDRRWAAYIASSHALTLEVMPPGPPPTNVLDVGIGTGLLIERLGMRWPSARFSGIDVSPAMLNVARARLAADVTLAAGSAANLPFANDSFDMAISVSALHYLSDAGQALREIDRVLRPGGVLVVTDWSGDHIAQRLLEIALRVTGRAHGKTLTLTELEGALDTAGLTVERTATARHNWLWHLMTARARKASQGLPDSA